MHLVIYGPEGSGKGTQAKLLSEKLNLPVLTAGDLVRIAAVEDKGRLGRICTLALTHGKYVPDWVIFKLWGKKLSTTGAKNGFIMDGFPRNIKQAKFLTREVEKSGYKIDKLIYLKISDKESIRRLSKRKRKLYPGSSLLHDSSERVRARLKIYRQKEKKLLNFFEDKNLLLTIDGEKKKEEVFNSILHGLSLNSPRL